MRRPDTGTDPMEPVDPGESARAGSPAEATARVTAPALPEPAQAPAKTLGRPQAATVGVVALGGAVGATARYAATVIWPTAADVFPWTTFAINVTGCAVMAVVMVLVTERFRPHPLLRPFLATGVIGGYTTFSTYAVDTQRLIDRGDAVTALVYLAGTLLACLATMALFTALTRLVFPASGRRA